jgi:anti-sigma factor RsiW
MVGETMPTSDPRKFLAAFADGELDVTQNLAVLEHMALHPDATRRVMHQQQLRQAVAQTLTATVRPAPDALRERIAQLATSAARSPSDVPTRPSLFARLLRALPLAIAAVVLLGVGVLIGSMVDSDRGGAATSHVVVAVAPRDHGPLPGTLVSRIARTHVNCARFGANHSAPPFPRELASLPEPVRQHLGQPAALPDLSALGFAFAGAEPCAIDDGKSVHLLYIRNADRRDTLSLFVQVNNGQLGIEPGKAYALDNDAAHPMVVWTSDGLVYYLMGDARKPVNEAAKAVGAPVS